MNDLVKRIYMLCDVVAVLMLIALVATVVYYCISKKETVKMQEEENAAKYIYCENQEISQESLVVLELAIDKICAKHNLTIAVLVGNWQSTELLDLAEEIITNKTRGEEVVIFLVSEQNLDVNVMISGSKNIDTAFLKVCTETFIGIADMEERVEILVKAIYIQLEDGIFWQEGQYIGSGKAVVNLTTAFLLNI